MAYQFYLQFGFVILFPVIQTLYVIFAIFLQLIQLI